MFLARLPAGGSPPHTPSSFVFGRGWYSGKWGRHQGRHASLSTGHTRGTWVSKFLPVCLLLICVLLQEASAPHPGRQGKSSSCPWFAQGTLNPLACPYLRAQPGSWLVPGAHAPAASPPSVPVRAGQGCSTHWKRKEETSSWFLEYVLGKLAINAFSVSLKWTLIFLKS